MAENGGTKTMSKNSNATRNLALGAIVAGAAGYLAGLLTAPRSGKESRKILQEKAVKAKHEAEVHLKKLHTELDKLIKQGKEQSKNFSAAGKKDWAKAVEVAIAAKDKVRVVLSAIHEGDADDKDLEKAIKQADEAVEHLKKYLSKNVEALKK